MADEFHNPHWGSMSAAVKDILKQAKRWSVIGKKPRVNCDHILNALVSNYPEEVVKEIRHLTAKQLTDILRNSFDPPGSSISSDLVINRSADIANKLGEKEILIQHLVKAAADYADFSRITGKTKKPGTPEKKGSLKTKSKTPTLDIYGRDLTEKAGKEGMHEIIGRDREIDLISETLCRVFKRNPLLVGSAGVGKTAVVEGLAQRIASGNITTELQNKRIIELSMSALLAGTKYRGMFEERMVQIIKEASNPDIILFIDEFHSVIGTGVAEGSPLDASTILLPALARGELACIGACTSSDYHKYIEKNKALDRRLQTIKIEELNQAATREVLTTIGPSKFEKRFDIRIAQDVYGEVVELANRYMRNRCFPDKAIDILDQAVGQVVRKEKKELTRQDVRNVIGTLTGLPVGKLEDELRNRLSGLNAFMKTRLMGQDHIIDAAVDIIWPKTQGMDLRPERPNGVFLFTGPTGVGKTEFAKTLTEYLFGSRRKMIRIDMSEYAEEHSVSRILGAPFGYAGYDKGSPVLDEILDKPFSVLLLDEIEKAHSNVHRLFLQIFDDGILTDTQGRHIFFSDVIIIMTSNVQVDERHLIGFQVDQTDVSDARQGLTGKFAPEFLNRIDYIGIFNSLSPETALQIVESKIVPLLIKQWQKKQVQLDFSTDAIQLIAVKGYTEKWGGRNLERTVDEMINSPLVKFISDKIGKEIKIFISTEDEEFKFIEI